MSGNYYLCPRLVPARRGLLVIMIKLNCKLCNKEFWVKPSRIGKAKYCSHSCRAIVCLKPYQFKKGYSFPEKWRSNLKKLHKGKRFSPNTEFKKGQSSWIKGTGIQTNTGRTHFKKGIRYSPETEFKKGQNANEKNSMWKGDNVGYCGIHRWVQRHKGKPKICEHCGATKEERKLHWANKDHNYSRNLDDYIALCVPCHRKHDKVLSL